MRAGVDVDEDAVGGEALGTVAGDGVAVIEVRNSRRVKIDLLSVVELRGEQTFSGDSLDRRPFSIEDAQPLVGRAVDARRRGRT